MFSRDLDREQTSSYPNQHRFDRETGYCEWECECGLVGSSVFCRGGHSYWIGYIETGGVAPICELEERHNSLVGGWIQRLALVVPSRIGLVRGNLIILVIDVYCDVCGIRKASDFECDLVLRCPLCYNVYRFVSSQGETGAIAGDVAFPPCEYSARSVSVINLRLN